MKNILHILLAGVLALGALGTAHAQSDEDTLIKRGAYLARVGDCVACHTVSGKPDFAGGLAIKSGLGTIYSTNITPDKTHGIGNYTEAQFADAVRKGVLPDGTHLYPAMPYPDYAKVTDEDIHALYAYFMKGVPASAEPSPKTSLSFPFNQRWGMSLWNMVFTSDKPFAPPPGATEQIKLGAYLVEGLGHCSSCHTARGVAMQQKADDSSDAKFLAGGNLNGWDVPSLRGMPTWSAQDIVDYLATGRNATAAVAGEMTDVVANSTSHMTDSDLQAIAAYLKSLDGGGKPPATADAEAVRQTIAKLTGAKDLTLGERLYLDNCAACHFVNGQGATRVFPRVDQASVVVAKNPTGLVNVILHGAQTPSTDRAPSVLPMPGFAQRLDDEETAALATFVRQAWTNRAAAVSASQVAEVREQAAEHAK